MSDNETCGASDIIVADRCLLVDVAGCSITGRCGLAGPMVAFDDLDVERIIELRRLGRSYQEIGDKVGTSRQRVHQVLRARAPELFGRLPRNDRLEILRLRKAGLNFKKISGKTGFSERFVKGVLREHGYTPVLPRDVGLTEEEVRGNTYFRWLLENKGLEEAREVVRLYRAMGELSRARYSAREAAAELGLSAQQVYGLNYHFGFRFRDSRVKHGRLCRKADRGDAEDREGFGEPLIPLEVAGISAEEYEGNVGLQTIMNWNNQKAREVVKRYRTLRGLASDGYTAVEDAGELGVSVSTVYRYAEKFGLEFRRR